MIRVPHTPRTLRWLALLWAVLIFLWLSPEDAYTWPVVTLGAGASVIAVITWTQNHVDIIPARRLPLLLALLGIGAGLSTSVVTAALMLLKNVRHAHIVPDFPVPMIGAILERAPVWALAGALIGMAAGFAWWAWTLKGSPLKTRIYLIRHGETDWNIEHRFQGQSDTDLNANGVQQAQAVARRLAALPETFSAIYASPLKRTVATAQPIAETLGLEVTTHPDLMEIFCGEWEGLNADEVEMTYPGQIRMWHQAISTYRLPGGECVNDVQKRVGAFYDSILPQHAGEAIIIVAHGLSLLSLVTYMHGWDIDATWANRSRRLKNTALTIVHYDIQTKRHEVITYNSIED